MTYIPISVCLGTRYGLLLYVVYTWASYDIKTECLHVVLISMYHALACSCNFLCDLPFSSDLLRLVYLNPLGISEGKMELKSDDNPNGHSLLDWGSIQSSVRVTTRQGVDVRHGQNMTLPVLLGAGAARSPLGNTKDIIFWSRFRGPKGFSV